jgi:hypothetical protein
MNTGEIQLLKSVIRETIAKATSEATSDRSLFPLYTTKQAARIFHVSEWTVRSWHKQGLLEGRYQILSGRACRLIFTNRAMADFFDRHFPLPEDFMAKETDPRSTEAVRLQRMFAMRKLYTRRRIYRG